MVANQSQEKLWSMEGILSMKQLSTALSFLTSRKRLYFGLDEGRNELVYYKNKFDFDRNTDCQGTIPLEGAICIPTANICVFVLHTSSKKYEIEADNVKCAECWLHALQRRKDLNDNQKTELSKIIHDSMKRYRSRSRSMPSDTEIPKKSMNRPKYPPTRRKTFKMDSLQPLPIDYSNHVNQSAPATPLKFTSSTQFFPSHKSRLSRCISLKVGNKPANVHGKSRIIVDKSKRRASLQESVDDKQLLEEVTQNPRHSLDTPPTWLNKWVDEWIDETLIWANHHKNESERNDQTNEELTDKSVDEKPDSPSACSPAETTSNNDLNSTATTSQCESDDRSSIHSSQPEIYDELLMLRQINNEQKSRIHTLNLELEKLKQQNKVNKKFVDESAFQDQNKVLNAEVVRMSEQCLGLDKQLQQFTKKCSGLENEIEDFKKEYVYLLQSSVHIPLNSNYDTIQVKLFGGDVHEKRVKKLLAQARELDPKLPTFESVTTPGTFHSDDYGFRHSFTEVPLALQYICTQLNSHYNTQSDEYARLKARWRLVLEANPNKIENNKTNRDLIRKGVPRSLRSKVWRVLINQQVSDLKKKYGEYYFRNLCSSQGTTNEKVYCSTHQKQINLDLLRTMPSNVHFLSASCKGVNHLQSVLRAFCLHDPIIGYCQGMNFLAATALLFVSPEDAFWFLIAITERYFDRSYFDQNLSGAQADQEVLKELVEMKLPKLSKHLENCSIDLATACLNWFLALFFDAIPFETMLKIWDCFLLEGPKVLFRFSIALLALYEEDILERTDTISVMKVLKAAVRLTYDSSGLMKFAFDQLNPFPTRTALQQKQRAYLEVLQEKLNQRMRLRKILEVAQLLGYFRIQSPLYAFYMCPYPECENTISPETTSEQICDLPIECIVWNEFKPNVGYVCAGNQKRGKLAMITIHPDATNLNALDLEFDCRPVSMVVPTKDMAFLSFLSNYIVAIQLTNDNARILWEIKLPDIGLKLLHNEERLLCALANGTLTVLEKAFVNQPTALDLYNIPIAAAPITDAIMDDDFLYLAVACKVVILDKHTLSPVSSLYVASSACGSHIPYFEKIRAFSHSIYGLWLITAHSSLIQLWLDSECQLLFDISFDHSHSSRRASIDDSDSGNSAEVYSILFHEDEVWVGTVDGYLMLYSVIQVEDSVFDRKSSLGTRTRSDMAAYALHRYPPGKRLSPIQTHNNQHADPSHIRQSMYYIPTAKERLVEEIISAKEYPEDSRQTRKISVIIDQSTKQYKVNVEAVRQYSQESSSTANNTTTERRRNLSSTTCGDNSEGSSTKGPVQSLRTRRQQRQLQLTKGQSIDSAVSMGNDSLNGQRQSPACETILESMPTIVSPRAETDPEQHTKTKPKVPLKRRTQSDSTHLVDISSPSMDYDDTFELYTEPEDQVPDIGLLEDTLQNSPTVVKSVQIPVRKMSSNVFGKSKALTIDESDASSMASCQSPKIRLRSDSAASESSIEMAVRNKRPSIASSISRVNSQKRPMRPKLRRKDLEIEDNATVLIAVKEIQHQLPTPSPSSSSDQSKDAFETEQKSQNHLTVEHGRWIDYTSRKPSLITNGVEEQLEEKAVNSSLSLSLQMKLKVSDKPLKCIALTNFEGEPVVVTGAGNYGDEEALLRWRREKNSGLWINDPMVDSSVVGRKRTVLSANGSVKRKK